MSWLRSLLGNVRDSVRTYIGAVGNYIRRATGLDRMIAMPEPEPAPAPAPSPDPDPEHDPDDPRFDEDLMVNGDDRNIPEHTEWTLASSTRRGVSLSLVSHFDDRNGLRSRFPPFPAQLANLRDVFREGIENYMRRDHSTVRIGLRFIVRFTNPTLADPFYIALGTDVDRPVNHVTMNDDISAILNEVFDHTDDQIAARVTNSGSIPSVALHAYINITHIQVPRGGSYIPTPSVLEHKRCLINVRNDEVFIHDCLRLSILAVMCRDKLKGNVNNARSYKKLLDKLKTPLPTDASGAQTEPFPCDAKMIARFEEMNKVRVYVSGMNEYHRESPRRDDEEAELEQLSRAVIAEMEQQDDEEAQLEQLSRDVIAEMQQDDEEAQLEQLSRDVIAEMQQDEAGSLLDDRDYEAESLDFIAQQEDLVCDDVDESAQERAPAVEFEEDADEEPVAATSAKQKRIVRDVIVPLIRSPHHKESSWPAYNVLFLPDQSTINGCNLKTYGHFIAIKKLSALVSTDDHPGYACNACHYFTRSAAQFETHMSIDCSSLVDFGTKLVCPKHDKSEVKFKRIHQMLRLPITCTMDSETRLEPVTQQAQGKTVVIKRHYATQFSIYTHVDPDAREYFHDHGIDQEETEWNFTDETNWASNAFRYLIHVANVLKQFTIDTAVGGACYKPLVMTDADEDLFAEANTCYLCNKRVSGNAKIRDHDHYTGSYRGCLCSECNIAYNLKRSKLTVWTHNLRGYDENLYLPIIAMIPKWSISVLANSTEKYLSFSMVPDKSISKQHMEICFIDSAQHFGGSLDMNVSMLMNSVMQLKSPQYCNIVRELEQALKPEVTKRDDNGRSQLSSSLDGFIACAPYVLSSHWSDLNYAYGRARIANPRAQMARFALANTDKPAECAAALEHLFAYYESCRPAIADKFAHTIERFGPDNAWFYTRKGAMPYDYISTNAKLLETELPPHSEWTNTMGSPVSKSRYEELVAQYEEMGCANILAFQTQYIASDTSLLADLVENWRLYVHSLLGVDPAHFVTIASLSWSAIFVHLMRNHLDTHVHAIEDENAHHLIRKNIRGGISVITQGHARANNRLMPDYDPSKPSTWIVYLDANALYSSTMLETLPENGIDAKSWIADLPDESASHEDCADYIREHGMNRFYEVDLHIPRDLHDKFNDYPPLMSNRSALWEEQSEFTQDLIRRGYGSDKIPSTVPKLIPSVQDEKHQLHHARYLMFLLDQGVQVTRMHRAITFNESPFLRDYVEKLSLERAKWKKSDPLRYAIVKLLLNAVYGRTLMNVLHQLNLRVESDDRRIARLAQHHNCRSVRPLAGDMRAIDVARSKITLSQPIAMGFAILEYSKLIMMNFYYNTLQKAYGSRVHLLMTDTDSLIVQIETPDLIEDIVHNDELRNALDLSEERASTFGGRIDVAQNAAVYGKFKTEVPFHNQIVEFIGLRSKVYALRLQNDKVKALAKGVDRAVKERCLQWSVYEQALRDVLTPDVTVHRFVHHQLQLETIRQEKRALVAVNDKRYYLDFEQPTLAFGHWRIGDQTE